MMDLDLWGRTRLPGSAAEGLARLLMARVNEGSSYVLEMCYLTKGLKIRFVDEREDQERKLKSLQGVDWLLLDTEHAPNEPPDVLAHA